MFVWALLVESQPSRKKFTASGKNRYAGVSLQFPDESCDQISTRGLCQRIGEFGKDPLRGEKVGVERPRGRDNPGMMLIGAID